MKPRQHFESIKVRPRTEWKDAVLNEVDPKFQNWVRTYLEIYVERMKFAKGTARERYLENRNANTA